MVCGSSNSKVPFALHRMLLSVVRRKNGSGSNWRGSLYNIIFNFKSKISAVGKVVASNGENCPSVKITITCTKTFNWSCEGVNSVNR